MPLYEVRSETIERNKLTIDHQSHPASEVDPQEERDQVNEKLTEITPTVIGEILIEYPNIQSLDFSHHLLSNIKSLEPTAATLLALNLSYNRLTFVNCDNCLGGLTSLVVLNLSHNKIESLAQSQIKNLPKLQELDLSFNKI